MIRTVAIASVSALLAAAAARATAPSAGPSPFVAGSDRSFAALMDESMTRMHEGMRDAPRSTNPDRDFVTQMIPHHQGAIDMAKALLLYGKDPALQRLSKEIVVEQQTEIQLMQEWLEKHPAVVPVGTEKP